MECDIGLRIIGSQRTVEEGGKDSLDKRRYLSDTGIERLSLSRTNHVSYKKVTARYIDQNAHAVSCKLEL
jgi:hypothetical protein